MKYTFVLCGHCLLTESESIPEAIIRLDKAVEMLIDMEESGVELVGEDEEGRLFLQTEDPQVAAKFGMEGEDGAAMEDMRN